MATSAVKKNLWSCTQGYYRHCNEVAGKRYRILKKKSIWVRVCNALTAFQSATSDQHLITVLGVDAVLLYNGCMQPSLNRVWDATYLFEGELDGLVLAQFQDVHELHDGFVATVQLVLTLDQLFLLLREVDKLVQSFLVDMTVFLQLCVALLQFSEQLFERKKDCINIHSGWSQAGSQTVSLKIFLLTLCPVNYHH